ncbi:MAG TPA: bifunctional demethylmenaquinone methyltransferase/2-methoxy-6-polyprenyl-1,4-benzoquinol methylase UbiE [Pirellulales bacterium]|jgi:demethylmenaquinone methyltransferase/2-methoxy-6-polyprenyl-1,4-benzoquinol methylase
MLTDPSAPPAPAVDKSASRVQRMFGEIAARYDFLNHLLSLGIDYYWRWRTVRRVRPEGAVPVLDLCTGTGDLALAYHRAAGGRAPIIGADFCRPMLDVGEAKRRRVGANRLAFVVADAERLPFPSESFQIVSVAFGLRNVSDTDRGLTEMTRVCRTGGSVAVLEFSTPTWQPFRAIYGWYFRHVLPRIGQLLARNPCDAYNYLPESVGQFPQGEALADRMRAAGLDPVRCYSLTLGVATLYVGVKSPAGASRSV